MLKKKKTDTGFKAKIYRKPLLDIIYVGNPAVPLNRKQALYQFWYIKHL